MNPAFFIKCLLVVGLALTAVQRLDAQPSPDGQDRYDLVIANGRVLDPETGLDAIRNLGIKFGRIVAISASPLAGRDVIDASGLVVAPGFIDLHSHITTVPSWWAAAHDGVTTALELEAGAWPVDKAYADAAAKRPPVNYGFSVGWYGARSAVLGNKAGELASSEDVARVIANVRAGLDAGGLGIGVAVGYLPDSNRFEYLELGHLAHERNVTIFTHVRWKNTREPRSVLEGVEEVVAIAAMTGARMHICHLNSSGLREIPRIVRAVRGAQSRGLPITTEAYPWGGGATAISAPFLAPDNLPLLNIRSTDLEILSTGERPASNERLAELRARAPSEESIIHYLNEANGADEALIAQALLIPGGMIASDSGDYAIGGKPITAERWPLPRNASGHPRSIASFSKVIGDYVRGKRLTLIEAVRRSSLLQAKLLESGAPEMRRKGRLQIDMDADIVVFDPDTIGAEATYAKPAKASRGVHHVIVGGKALIRNGQLRTEVRAGRAITGRSQL